MKKDNISAILLSVMMAIFIFFVGINVESIAQPNQIYKVYLNGKTIGLIKSEDELVNLIDEKQEEIKKKYNVTKIYPPKGLEIKKEYTYSTNINTALELYEIIQKADPFTISGYTAKIKYPEEMEKETETINVLRKEDFEKGFEDVVMAFVGEDEYQLFKTEKQEEITETGTKIETIYWEETITLKEELINVDSFIFENKDDISKYLLFGTLEEQERYSIKDGDDISSIAYNNNLSPEEFLVANPEFINKNVLLSPGQTVNVGLIKPIVTIVAELHIVEDVVERHETEYIDDENKMYGQSEVLQEGKDGLMRVNEKVLYKNGEINNLVIMDNLTETITPAINEIVKRGIATGSYDGFQTYVGGAWAWPTNNPSVITSRFGPRWGRNHNGIDISGTGFASPIYASNDGVVILNETAPSGYGHYIVIDHENGYFTIYAHFCEPSPLKVGTRVKRGQIVGLMGSTGFSFGTHLHFGVVKDTVFRHTNFVDPCNSVFKC